MVIAMFLAHLVGDYVLQWDGLAQWKSRELKGVIAHSIIVFAVTAFFAIPFDSTWIEGILIISLSHFAIDAAQFFFRPSISPLLRFFIDQLLHLFFILMALILGGYITLNNLWGDIAASAETTPLLTTMLGYAFITMPAWVLLKFLTYGLVKGQAPNFPAGPNKFVGITERLIITTLVLFGQVLLVPLVTLPRLIVEWPKVISSGRDNIYLVELIASVALAVIVGLWLHTF